MAKRQSSLDQSPRFLSLEGVSRRMEFREDSRENDGDRRAVSENVGSSVAEARLRKASTFPGSLNHMAIESNGKIPEGLQALPAPRMSQPQAMKTERYVYGVEEMNGFDAWTLFEACARGDVPKAKALLTKDPRLAN